MVIAKLFYRGDTIPGFKRQFWFQYLPAVLTQRQGGGWVEVKPPGLDGTVHQFVHTDARELRIESFWNIYGERKNDRDILYIEDHISWLYQMITPQKMLGELRVAPKRLTFLYGEKKFGEKRPGFQCILTEVETNEQITDLETGHILRANINITLRKDVQFPDIRR